MFILSKWQLFTQSWWFLRTQDKALMKYSVNRYWCMSHACVYVCVCMCTTSRQPTGFMTENYRVKIHHLFEPLSTQSFLMWSLYNRFINNLGCIWLQPLFAALSCWWGNNNIQVCVLLTRNIPSNWMNTKIYLKCN